MISELDLGRRKGACKDVQFFSHLHCENICRGKVISGICLFKDGKHFGKRRTCAYPIGHYLQTTK